MAITTLDQLVAGMQPPTQVVKGSATGEAAGFLHSTWLLAGFPGAAPTMPTTLGGDVLVGPDVPGQILFPGAVTGTSIYLARYEAASASGVGAATLIDRIWHNGGIAITATSAQAIAHAAWDRDAVFDGTFTGAGVQVGLEVSVETGNTAAISNTTISYTNEAGVTGRTGRLNRPFPATGVVGTLVSFALQAGDKGVRSVQSITLGTSYASGTIHLVAYRQLVTLGMATTSGASADGLSLGLPRMHDNSVPQLLYSLTSTILGVTSFGLVWAQG